MKIGFIGVRTGVSLGQENTIYKLLASITSPTKILIHSDTRGADEVIHSIGIELGYRIEIYPPSEPDYRAFLSPIHEEHPATDYLQRYRLIVESSDLVIGAPSSASFDDMEKSAVWNSINNAYFMRKKVYLVSPKGNCWIPCSNYRFEWMICSG